jgi:hypothetical protein
VEDVASSVAALLHTIGKIAVMVKACDVYGKIGHVMSKCTAAVGGLVANTATLVAGSSKVADYCSAGAPADLVLERLTPIGKCFEKVTGAATMLIASTSTITEIAKKECKGHECTERILELIHVLSEFGAHFAGAFDNCESAKGAENGLAEEYGISNQQALCAEHILEVVSGLTGLAHNGYVTKFACAVPKKDRLYSVNAVAADSTGHTMTWTLAAAVPIASLLSFFGGLRFAKSRKAGATRIVEHVAEDRELLSERQGLMNSI